MASARDGLLAALATAILVWSGNGLNPWWPALWFAPVPVLWFALRCRSARGAMCVASAGWLAGCLNLWPYLRALQTPFAVWLAIFGVSALVFATGVSMFRALVLRGAALRGMLALPALWAGYEYLRNLATPHGTAGSIAYSQLSFLPFLQMASLTGPWGMSFILLLFPAALVIAGRDRRSRAAWTAFAATAAVLISGAIRLAVPASGGTVTVGLIASDQAEYGPVAGDGAPTARLLGEYARLAGQLTARGAQAIVLPEKVGVVPDSEVLALDRVFQRVADQSGAVLVTGVIQVSGPVKYNRARIYSPHAGVRTYDKQHMLPPFETGFRPGGSVTLLRREDRTWGVAICKDMDFTGLAREYGKAGAGLMLVPGWDFRMDRAWHGHIAIMRGVENGFSVVRSSRDGNLTVSDNRGRILAEAESSQSGFATLLAAVPVAPAATLYTWAGDWFAWLSIAILVAVVFPLARTQQR